MAFRDAFALPLKTRRKMVKPLVNLAKSRCAVYIPNINTITIKRTLISLSI